jgi:hypothetical protein
VAVKVPMKAAPMSLLTSDHSCFICEREQSIKQIFDEAMQWRVLATLLGA